MSDSVSSPEEPRGENKLSGKLKWRGKLFSADSRFGRAAGKLESTDDAITNFLHTAGSRPEAGPRSAPLAPRIDIPATSRRVSVASVDQEDRIVDVYRRPKPRQNKGLRVRFETTPPAVIGVGGDKAELPPRDVSRSPRNLLRSERSSSQEQLQYTASDQNMEAYERSNDQYMAAYGRSSDQHIKGYGKSGKSNDETSFRLSSPRKRPNEVDSEFPAEESHHAVHHWEAAESALPEIPKFSPRPQDGQQNQDINLRNNNVRNVSHKSSAANEEISYDQNYNRHTPEMRGLGKTRHSVVLPAEDLPATYLTSNESPESSHIFQEALPSSYYSPSATRVPLKLPDPPKLPDLGHRGIRQGPQEGSPSLKDKPLSLRSVAKSLGDESLEEFDLRVRRFNDLFRLNASAHLNMMAVPFERWVRTSAWWFLRGRGGLESAVRAKASIIATASAANDRGLSSILKQSYIDLAKAWWILKHVTPNHPAIRRFGNGSMGSMLAIIRSFGDKPLVELVEVHLTLSSSMRALTMSMARNGRLPPDNLQMQRLELQIFLETPTLPSQIAALMVSKIFNPINKGLNHVADPFFPILVGDTPRHFSFCTIFVDVALDHFNDAKSRVSIPCVLSVLRERIDWAVKVAITSQDGQVNLVIQSDGHGGLYWHDVQWIISLHTMQLGITEGIRLQIKFSEKDFKTIWGICDYTQQIRKEYSARRGEEAVYERELPIVQCFDCPSFPTEPVKDCRVRLFERHSAVADNNGQQRAHDGYRLIVVTPPGTKALSKVNYQLGEYSPILFSTNKGKNTLLVRVPSSLRVSLAFHEASDVKLFRSTLSGTSITEDDHCSDFLHLQNFTFSPMSADQDIAYINSNRSISGLRWHKLRVVSRGSSNHGHNSPSIARSAHLRILADCDSGTLTDRIHSGPGELQLNLSVEDLNQFKLLRSPQQGMTWAFNDGALGEADLSSLSNVLHSMGTSPFARTYHFRSLSDLHSFQAILTGFCVLYDGLASTLSISRRRQVVPMHKRWEASTPRLQIVKHDKTVQLVAFFRDFSHGACMNFALKVTDVFDTFARSGVFFLRIVDAKFALPKGESDPARDFVCLDMPDFPGEHDDIMIGFDNEQGEHSKGLPFSKEMSN